MSEPWQDYTSESSGPWADYSGATTQGAPSDYEIRYKKYHEAMQDPEFRAKPPEERVEIARRMRPALPTETRTETPLAPSLGIGQAITEEGMAGNRLYQEGQREFGQPIDPSALPGLPFGAGAQAIWPVAKMAMGALQSGAAPLTGTLRSVVSRPLGNLIRWQDWIPDPETAAQQAEITSDIVLPMALSMPIFKGRSLYDLTKTGLKRLLPTKMEKAAGIERATGLDIAATQREAEQKLADLGKFADRKTVDILQNELAAKRGASHQVGGIRTRLAAQQTRVGSEAASAAAPSPPVETNFHARYENLRKQASIVKAEPNNLLETSKKIAQERGFESLPTNMAERNAAGLVDEIANRGALPIAKPKVELPPDAVRGMVRDRLREMVQAGTDPSKLNYGTIVADVVGDAAEQGVSMETLLSARQRLRFAEYGAYDAGHKNLGRQFGEMERAITKDITAADKAVNARVDMPWKLVDKDYHAQKSGEWWTEGVGEGFSPTTGEFDRGRFTRWFEKYANDIDNDKFLKSRLGDQYDNARRLVGDMQKANSVTTDGIAKTTIENLARRNIGEIKKNLGQTMESLEKQTKEIQKLIERDAKSIKTGTSNAIEKLTDDMKVQIEKMTGKPYTEYTGRWIGPLMVVHGLGTMIRGMFTGAAGVATGGATSIGAGGLTILTHDAMIKAINSGRGLSLMRRLVRSAPGTGEAISASTALVNLLNQGQNVPGAITKGVDNALSLFAEAPRQLSGELPPIEPESKKAEFLIRHGIQ